MDTDQLKPSHTAGAVPGVSANMTQQSYATPPSAPGDGEEGLALGEIIAVLIDYRWLIAATCLFAVIVGLLWVVIASPTYRADGLLQIEEKKGGGGVLKALEPLLGDTTTAPAEVEILSSRMVLGRVVSKLRLDIIARPRTFPLIGAAVARRYEGAEPNSPWFGLSSFAWGGERIQVDSLEVPVHALDEEHELVAGAGGSFEIFDEDDQMVLAGKAGTRATDKGYSIFIAELAARPGTRFSLAKLSPETAIESLRKNYSVKERGKKTGVLELSLVGKRPDEIVLILDDIMNTYVRQNVERRSAEAEKTLNFLDTQLPALKTQVDSAEAAYNSYRQSRGSLDLSLETMNCGRTSRRSIRASRPSTASWRASTNAASSSTRMSHACPTRNRPCCAWRVTSRSRTGCIPSCSTPRSSCAFRRPGPSATFASSTRRRSLANRSAPSRLPSSPSPCCSESSPAW